MNIQLFRTLFSKNLTPGLLFGARKGLSERNFGRNGFSESGKHPKPDREAVQCRRPPSVGAEGTEGAEGAEGPDGSPASG